MSAAHTRNILRVFRNATENDLNEGMNWYFLRHDLALDIGNGDEWKGAGVIAAYSPLTPWWRNVELAVDSCFSGIARTDTLGNSARAAQRILDGEWALDVLRGPKTSAFCENIATKGLFGSATIDVHAFSIAMGKPIPSSKLSMNNALYNELAQSYSNAAKREGVLTTQMQAVTWIAWRSLLKKNAEDKKANQIRLNFMIERRAI